MKESLERWRRLAVNGGYVRHYGGFVLAGVSALATDTAVLAFLTRIVGMSPFIARPFGIAVAMVVSWQINRNVTFATRSRPSFTEFTRFAGVSITSQIVNYGVFATLLILFPLLIPEVALLLACFVSMFVSYIGFRFGVFGATGPRPREGRS